MRSFGVGIGIKIGDDGARPWITATEAPVATRSYDGQPLAEIGDPDWQTTANYASNAGTIARADLVRDAGGTYAVLTAPPAKGDALLIEVEDSVGTIRRWPLGVTEYRFALEMDAPEQIIVADWNDIVPNGATASETITGGTYDGEAITVTKGAEPEAVLPPKASYTTLGLGDQIKVRPALWIVPPGATVGSSATDLHRNGVLALSGITLPHTIVAGDQGTNLTFVERLTVNAVELSSASAAVAVPAAA